MIWFRIALLAASIVVGFIAGFLIARRNSYEGAFARKFGFKPSKLGRHFASYHQMRVDAVLQEKADNFLRFCSFQNEVLRGMKDGKLGDVNFPNFIALKLLLRSMREDVRGEGGFYDAMKKRFKRYKSCRSIGRLEKLMKEDAARLKKEFWLSVECARRCGFEVSDSIKDYSAQPAS